MSMSSSPFDRVVFLGKFSEIVERLDYLHYGPSPSSDPTPCVAYFAWMDYEVPMYGVLYKRFFFWDTE